MSRSTSEAVRWHELECWGYDADLALWRELAAQAGGAGVLDVGCGTGRVALDLARRGHRVIGLDRDPELIAELARRAAGLPLTAVRADARDFALEARVALCIVPMQTIQLLGGAAGRGAFLRCARGHLLPGGILAAALADPLDGLDVELEALPTPDVAEHDGLRYVSQPLGIRSEEHAHALERLRTVSGHGHAATEALEVVRLDRVTPAELEREGAAVGLAPAPRRRVAETAEHVGSEVVVLRG